MAYNSGFSFDGAGGFDSSSAGGFGSASGGFFADSDNKPSGGGFGGGDRTSRPNTQQSLTPLTLKQLNNAKDGDADGQVVVDGHVLDRVCVVGMILSVQAGSTNTNLVLDDGTGTAEVREWSNDEDTEWQKQQRLLWTEGSYVRAVVQVKALNNQRRFVASQVFVVEDKNELTHHLLDCIRVHLVREKGSGSASSSSSGVGNAMETESKGSGGAYRPQDYTNAGGMDKTQQAVLDVIKQGGSGDKGMHIDDVTSRLSEVADGKQVREAVDFLCNEGHLFSTFDDNHFRAC